MNTSETKNVAQSAVSKLRGASFDYLLLNMITLW